MMWLLLLNAAVVGVDVCAAIPCSFVCSFVRRSLRSVSGAYSVELLLCWQLEDAMEGGCAMIV